ncbi:MAG: isoleucyl-tRNA synthetase [Rickettsiales bacterium]|jgi:isoleucyl-tRNA synthetase
MKKNLSVHLQDFPDVSFLRDEKELTSDMDMVRQICSAALFIRDKENLRVRLPLSTLNIIGEKSDRMLAYKDIISEEVNVKNIQITHEIGDLAEVKLQINLKKVGAKLGKKMKDIQIALRSGDWKKLEKNKIEIAGETLIDDEFEIKLITKNSHNTTALPSNDCLVELDINLTKELEEEGLARDIVRAIQQNRKDANLNVSNHIKIAILSPDTQLLRVVKNFDSYIREQTLTDEILLSNEPSALQNYQFSFDNKIEEKDFKIAISL